MIRILLFTKGKHTQKVEANQIKDALENPENTLWIDLNAETEENCKAIMQDIFDFHPLAIDDALQETHSPKVDDWDKYLYIVLRSVNVKSQETWELTTPELDIFIGSNYLLTYQEETIKAVDNVWDLCFQDHRYASKGISYLLYHISDDIVTNTMKAIEDLGDRLDEIEDEIFTEPKPEILEYIFSAKRSIWDLRRAILPQREVFNKLSRGEYALIPKNDQVYFRDLYDHMVRLQEINESLRDLVSGALDTYLSVVNNRMNDIMKTLTIITTLFMPLSFLTGFFGMNFFQAVVPMEAWTGKLAFLLVLIGMIMTPLGIYSWIKRRAWV